MRLGFGLFTAACSVALFHCSSLPDTCQGAACGVAPDGSMSEGGTDGGADVAQPPAGCDPAADPKDAPKCVVSDFGGFVDATTGSDGNAGTKDSPVKSITAALGKLGTKTRVYICEGTYAEHVKLTNAVSLYGGFACGAWSYSGTKATIAPTDKGYAVEVRGVTSPMTLADLGFTARDGVAAGESSVAGFVASATQVTFRRASLTAGKGVAGTDGTDPGAFAPLNAPDGTSGSAAVNPGAATPNPACPTSIGGVGGKDGAANGGAGVVAVVPAYPATSTGVGGVGGEACGITGPRNGSYGIGGTSGAGAAKPGTLTSDGWTPSDGALGGAGGNGQGGGGGAQVSATGVGGSGGPGGCGGAAGPKGTGGGSSIALLVFESAVALDQTSLTASDAGRGGNGAKGQVAQLAGNKGSSSGAKACDGGYGGIGGSGGGGGGGAGGLSAGLLYTGAAPTFDGASTAAADTLPRVTLGTPGAAGAKGVGGAAADPGAPPSRPGADGTDGAAGQAQAVMSAP